MCVQVGEKLTTSGHGFREAVKFYLPKVLNALYANSLQKYKSGQVVPAQGTECPVLIHCKKKPSE
jgi:hypothetical protein